MIPALRNSAAAPHPLYSAFLAELWVRGFAGNLSDAYSDHTVLATDNSIYQMLPQAIAFPSNVDDLVRIARLAGEPHHRNKRRRKMGSGASRCCQGSVEHCACGARVVLSAGTIDLKSRDDWRHDEAPTPAVRDPVCTARHGITCSMTSVLSDGTVWSSEPGEEKELSSILWRTDRS